MKIHVVWILPLNNTQDVYCLHLNAALKPTRADPAETEMVTTVKNTPHVSLFPRERGAITGEVIPAGQKCPMDDAPAVNDDVITLRVADFAEYRTGGARKPISLGKGCNVILFPRRAEVEDDLIRSNVIFGLFPDPTPPQGGAPAAVARAA